MKKGDIVYFLHAPIRRRLKFLKLKVIELRGDEDSYVYASVEDVYVYARVGPPEPRISEKRDFPVESVHTEKSFPKKNLVKWLFEIGVSK